MVVALHSTKSHGCAWAAGHTCVEDQPTYPDTSLGPGETQSSREGYTSSHCQQDHPDRATSHATLVHNHHLVAGWGIHLSCVCVPVKPTRSNTT